MKQCKYCKSAIDNEATRCPYCRKKQNSNGWSIFAIIVLTVATCALIGFLINLTGKKNVTVSKNKVSHTEEVQTKPVKIGDTIKTDGMEIKIEKIEFSYDVLPDDKEVFYSHYPADEGNVYIHIDTNVKNIAKKKLRCTKIMDVIANYDDGYQYDSKTIPEDSVTGFTYANITSINPLEKLGVRFLIECPEEIAETDKPLVLAFKIDGVDDIYTYTMK